MLFLRKEFWGSLRFLVHCLLIIIGISSIYRCRLPHTVLWLYFLNLNIWLFNLQKFPLTLKLRLPITKLILTHLLTLSEHLLTLLLILIHKTSLNLGWSVLFYLVWNTIHCIHYLFLHFFLYLNLLTLIIWIKNVHSFKVKSTNTSHEGLFEIFLHHCLVFVFLVNDSASFI